MAMLFSGRNASEVRAIGDVVVMRVTGRPRTDKPVLEKRPRGRPRQDKPVIEKRPRGRPIK